jgi:hypothetical protein
VRDSTQGQFKLTDLLHDYWKIFTRESSRIFPHATISFLFGKMALTSFSVVNTATKEIHDDKYKKAYIYKLQPACTFHNAQ